MLLRPPRVFSGVLSCALVVLGQGRQKVERAGGLGQSGTWMLLGMIGWIMGVQRFSEGGRMAAERRPGGIGYYRWLLRAGIA